MSGDYTCSVSTFKSEDSQMKRMIVLGKCCLIGHLFWVTPPEMSLVSHAALFTVIVSSFREDAGVNESCLDTSKFSWSARQRCSYFEYT